ncbi:hypothetical protein V6N12_057210 [Hibiscus sabdariffa]|uniref:Uncharacterized protein n=1 Tax=Hibiscus sabdariffa TaxID=183260 RepID=A0ABR2APS5_9ROSI
MGLNCELLHSYCAREGCNWMAAGENGESPTAVVVLGTDGATVAPVIGSVQAGVRKVKSVNTLVEALGSPAQKRVIVAAKSRQGRGRPVKARIEGVDEVVAQGGAGSTLLEDRRVWTQALWQVIRRKE